MILIVSNDVIRMSFTLETSSLFLFYGKGIDKYENIYSRYFCKQEYFYSSPKLISSSL